MKLTHTPRVALIGYGKMGREIESIATEFNITITNIIDANISGKESVITSRTLSNVDVCIEFTEPDAVVSNIKAVAQLGKNIVVGTTGWNDKMNEVREIVEQHKIGLLYASNFSIGMNLFQKLAAEAGRIFSAIDSYDCFIHEAHHAKKKDAPSGTALTLGNILLSTLRKKKNIVMGNVEGQVPPDALQISSSRGGAIPGTHTITFDSMADTIELTHTARSRRGFAEGALIAASWLHNKKGMYSMEDVLNDIESI